MNIEQYLEKLKSSPNSMQFEDTMAVIEANYDFTPVAFSHGKVTNAAGENSGSCKVFAFAQLHNLTKDQTLTCFGQYYRDVLADLKGESHQNIRQFMQTGWATLNFDKKALKKT